MAKEKKKPKTINKESTKKPTIGTGLPGPGRGYKKPIPPETLKWLSDLFGTDMPEDILLLLAELTTSRDVKLRLKSFEIISKRLPPLILERPNVYEPILAEFIQWKARKSLSGEILEHRAEGDS